MSRYRDQGIAERFNRTLAERIFSRQYALELLLAAKGSSKRSTEWVKALPEVIRTHNDEKNHIIGKKPSVAHKSTSPIRPQNKGKAIAVC